MLTTILNSIPPPPIVIIQDNLAIPGKNVLYSLIRSSLKLKNFQIHFFTFETIQNKIPSEFLCNNLLKVHDFLTDNQGWLDTKNVKNFENYVIDNKISGIIVIDSLAHFILEYGLTEMYKILSKLIYEKENKIIQILTVLHEDTLEFSEETLKCINYLPSLHLKLFIVGKNNRVEYKYKKRGGKIIKKIEEYYFENNVFFTKELEKIDPKVIFANATSDELPENMSTFRIGLDDNEKQSRDELVLPYMNKTNVTQSGESSGGKVFYNFDEEDDWDEEDPDDDLDI